MNDIKILKDIKNKLLSAKGSKLIVILGFIGMTLILISEFVPEKSDKKIKEKEMYKTSDYSSYTERQIEMMLSKIDGVGKVNVTLMVSGTEEYIYAQQNKSNISQNGESNSSQNENSYIFVQKNGDKEALVQKVINPAISGVVVVCEGGGNSVVRESVYKAVSVSLNIASNKIYVTKLE